MYLMACSKLWQNLATQTAAKGFSAPLHPHQHHREASSTEARGWQLVAVLNSPP